MSPQIRLPPTYDPYAAPHASGGFPTAFIPPFALRRGDALVFPKGAQLPHACVKCGAAHDLTRGERTFRYLPPWTMPFFFSGIGIVLVLLLRPKGSAHMSVCAACDKRLRSALRAMWIGMGLMFAGFLPVIALGTLEAMMVTGILVLIAAVAVMVASVLTRRAQLVFVQKIDKTNLWLRGIHPIVADRMVMGGPSPTP